MPSRDNVRPCPACGGTLHLISDGMVGVTMAPAFFTVGQDRLRHAWQLRPFWACSSCEFCTMTIG